jgi:diacylglycerol kinase (ATP)
LTKARGFRRLVNATRYSWAGLRTAFRNEAAFRQELALAALMIPLALVLTGDGVERALLIACVMLVLVVELLNSAIEAAIDRFGGAQHPLSASAKDLGSAAVSVSLVLTAVVWVLVLFP